VAFFQKQDFSDILTEQELLDAEWRIAECNALIEDQRQRIEKLAYEGYDISSALIVYDSLCVNLALHVQTRNRLRTMLNVNVA
jgi:hypothetical protein